MTKFLILWEIDTTKLPEKCEDQMSLYLEQLSAIKGELEKKNMLDWGAFVGTTEGYSICEGTEQEIDFGLLQWIPYLKFKVYPILSVDQQIENIKKLQKA